MLSALCHINFRKHHSISSTYVAVEFYAVLLPVFILYYYTTCQNYRA